MSREIDDSTNALLAAMRNVSAAMTAQVYFEHLVDWLKLQVDEAETAECKSILSRALRLAESYSDCEVRKSLADTDVLLLTALTKTEGRQ